MRSTVTSMAWMAGAAVLALFAGATPALAQETVTANVPFEFRVGSRVMPAGEYWVATESDPMVISITNHHNAGAFVLAIPASMSDGGPQEPPELVFAKIGDVYRLEGIVMVDDYVRAVPGPSEGQVRATDHVAVLLHRGPAERGLH